MKTSWKIGAIVALVAVVALTATGISYAANGNPNPGGKSLCTFSYATVTDNGHGVAVTTATPSGASMTIQMNNVYPGYLANVQFGLSNQWTTPGIVQPITVSNAYSPDVLNLQLSGVAQNQIINAGSVTNGTLAITVGNVLPKQSLSFDITIPVVQYVTKGQQFVVGTTSLPNGEFGVAYNQTLTAYNGNPPYTWSLPSGSLPNGLTLNGSGAITGTPTTTGTFNFSVCATDSTGDTANANLSIAVIRPAVSTTTLPDGDVNVAYSQTLMATGGSGSGYSWSKYGSWPSWLSLSSGGVISGTVATTGTYSFSVTVTDSLGSTSLPANLSIKINPALSIITASPLPPGKTGTAYNQTLVATGGSGSQSWTITSGSLPKGLSLSSGGVISGTPSKTGTSTFTVKVTDAAGGTATKSLSITVH